MNLPNKLTLTRVFMIPFFIFFMLYDGFSWGKYAACALFVIASMTDALDGYIARKYHLITNFGKFMDPLADKLLVCSALICFVAKGPEYLPAWAAIIIVAREFIISGFRLVASDNGIVIAASYWGKVKTVSQMLMSIFLILHLDNPVYHIVEQIFIYLSVALTIISLVDYLVKNKAVLKEQK